MIGQTVNKGHYASTSNISKLSTKTRYIRLKGRKDAVKVSLHTFSGRSDIETKSRIPTQNFRIQELLTADSLDDLADLKETQTSPCLCYKSDDGIIFFIDGSRRRARAIMDDCALEYELIEDRLTENEIEALVLTADNHKPVSNYEYGKYYGELLAKSDLNQKEFAKTKGISEVKLTKCLKAFKVPKPIYYEYTKRGFGISERDVNAFVAASEIVKNTNLDVDAFFLSIVDDTASKNTDMPKDVFKKKVTQLLNRRIKKINEVSTTKLKRKKDDEVIYESEDGKASVLLVTTSKSNKVIKMRNVTEEQTDKIKVLISTALNDPERFNRILNLLK